MDQQTNDLTDLAGVVAMQPLGGKYKDKNGKYKDIPIDDNDFKMDFSGVGMGNDSGGNTGGTDLSHPSAGDDYYPGSLADGELTDRIPLFEGNTDYTKITTVVLSKDVGSNFNMVGDGIMILAHLVKVSVEKGVKGETSNVEFNYDINNKLKEGFYTTTSPYPACLKSIDLGTRRKLSIPFEGVGEGLEGTNTKAPVLNITFKDNNTVDIESEEGFDNDGATSGVTGASYYAVVDFITTFSKGDAVTQLPKGISVFAGSSYGPITLAGVEDYYTNVPNGLIITFDPYMWFYKKTTNENGYQVKLSDLSISDSIIVDKAHLVADRSFSSPNFPTSVGSITSSKYNFTGNIPSGTGWIQDPINYGLYITKQSLSGIEELTTTSNSISTTDKLFEGVFNRNSSNEEMYARMRIIKIETY